MRTGVRLRRKTPILQERRMTFMRLGVTSRHKTKVFQTRRMTLMRMGVPSRRQTKTHDAHVLTRYIALQTQSFKSQITEQEA